MNTVTLSKLTPGILFYTVLSSIGKSIVLSLMLYVVGIICAVGARATSSIFSSRALSIIFIFCGVSFVTILIHTLAKKPWVKVEEQYSPIDHTFGG